MARSGVATSASTAKSGEQREDEMEEEGMEDYMRRTNTRSEAVITTGRAESVHQFRL
jgi:hypothetical protein